MLADVTNSRRGVASRETTATRWRQREAGGRLFESGIMLASFAGTDQETFILHANAVPKRAGEGSLIWGKLGRVETEIQRRSGDVPRVCVCVKGLKREIIGNSIVACRRNTPVFTHFSPSDQRQVLEKL